MAEDGKEKVYFCQAGKNGPIKIGHTTNLSKRVHDIQTHCAEKVNLLGFIYGGRETEQLLHKFFDGYKMKGEWFEPSVYVMNYIMGLITGIDLNSLDAIPGDIGLNKMLANIEKRFIISALKQAGSVKKAAPILQLTYRQLRYRIAVLGIEKSF